MTTKKHPLIALLQQPRNWIRKTVKVIWILFFTFLISVPLYVLAVIHNPFDLFGGMPSFKQIENPESDQSSEIISADGIVLGRYARLNRSNAEYEELSPVLVRTLLISEDHRFFEHAGMDMWSYLRVVKGLITMHNEGGGSTLSQQTAKNLYRTRGEDLRGKLGKLGGPVELVISKTKEWIIAVKLEKNFTKEEIITLYLNTVPFNNNAYGIRVASETYYQKPPSDLNIQESALLVGMLQGTYLFDPVAFPERALRKRNQVLAKLYDHHYIKSGAVLDSLMALPLQLNFSVQDHNEGIATHFRMAARVDLLRWAKENGYDLFDSGLKIYTTIDSRMQRLAEKTLYQRMTKLQKSFESEWGDQNPWTDQKGHEIKDFLQKKIKRTAYYKHLASKFGENSDSIGHYLNLKKTMRIFTWRGDADTTFSMMDSLRYYNRLLQCGMVSIDPRSGAVKAWVGGNDYRYFQYDHVQQARRQPGSTFKPFVYGKAMEDGYSPCHVFRDISPSITVNGNIYRVTNYDGTYGNGSPYTLRQALARSLNTITIQMIDKLKPVNVADFAKRIGITSELDPVHALGLGTSEVSLLEMVSAYSTFVNAGIHIAPHYITRIEDKDGNVIQSFTPSSKQGTDEVTAYKIVHLLKGGVEEPGGTSSKLSNAVTDDNEVGGKTGTTDDASDGWYIGITHNLVTGVWVGGDERSIHFKRWELGSGTRTALPVWDDFMTSVYMYSHRLGYRKGSFNIPQSEIGITFDCSKFSSTQDFSIANE